MLKKFESNVQYIKYLVNKEIVKIFNSGESVEDNLGKLSETIIPGPKPMTRCCIYKERHIVEERAKIILNPLKGKNVIQIIPDACDECPIDRFFVTEACRGCLGHQCRDNCPKDAIMIINHRAYIDQNKCIECGKCKAVCPFNAISEVQRPCMRSCAIGALQTDENKKAYIDDEKCVSCGACVYNCPFGAIVDKSYVFDILNLIKDSQNNEKYNVYAIVAPAIASQFTEYKLGQVVSAIQKIGFSKVYEAALGADIVACHEAEEFAETVGEKQFKTTSCCPAFVDYVEKNYPQLMERVSETVSPMIAMARLIRRDDKNCKIVFIGPCTAKKAEINKDDLKGDVDYVLTFGELRSIFDGLEINIGECDEQELTDASYYGRIFAKSGGVTEAVKQVIDLKNIDVELKPIKCDGLAECVKMLKVAAMGKLPANFMEGMACKGGCVGGAASVSHGVKDISELDKYGKASIKENSVEVIKALDLDNLDLERKFDAKEER